MPRRLRTSSSHFRSASSVVTFSSEPIGSRCRTFTNLSDRPPTRRVGESGVASSGWSSSSATSSSKRASQAACSLTGSSSTWYAMRARLRTSRNSDARAAAVVVLEDAKELLGRVDDRVGLFSLESRSVMDPAPCLRDGEHARRLRCADVEGRGAGVGGAGGVAAKPLYPEEQRRRVGLVPLGLVAADD